MDRLFNRFLYCLIFGSAFLTPLAIFKEYHGYHRYLEELSYNHDCQKKALYCPPFKYDYEFIIQLPLNSDLILSYARLFLPIIYLAWFTASVTYIVDDSECHKGKRYFWFIFSHLILLGAITSSWLWLLASYAD